MKQTILNRLFATHLSDSAKGTDVSIQPIFQKKRPPVMLILLPTLFILLCGSLVSCQASQEDSDLAAITQNKTSDSSVSDQDHENQEILNSVTYIDIDGVYFPISYVNHGEQLLSGDVGPYSAFAESLLKEAPPASGLNKIDLPDIDTDAAGLGPIASNGTWDFFPDKATYQTYSFDNQPNESDWIEYFKERLSASNYDGPIIIQESVTFQWDGIESAIVTASNVIISGDDGDSWANQDDCQTAMSPENYTPSIYIISALFTQGNTPIELVNQYCEILKEQEEYSEIGISYMPWDNNYSQYMQFISAIQYDSSGTATEFPIFSNMNGSLVIRDFQYMPRYLVSDIDGDSESEVIVNLSRASSSMSFCKAYKMKQAIPKEVLCITLN